MIQLRLDFKFPGGKVGNVFRVLMLTHKLDPLTPLDLAMNPERYGTDCVRNIKHAARHFAALGYTVESVPVKGESYNRYFIKRRSDISERRDQ